MAGFLRRGSGSGKIYCASKGPINLLILALIWVPGMNLEESRSPPSLASTLTDGQAV
jgi:hypothetical protein